MAPVQATVAVGLSPLERLSAAGGSDLHNGIRLAPHDSYAQTLTNTVDVVHRLATSSGAALRAGARVLDLGAGLGGPAHRLAAATGARVTCVDICASRNAENARRADAAGVAALVDVVRASFEALPPEWTAAFDVVWSVDALAYAVDKSAAIAEAARVMKAGAILVFSDVILAPSAYPSSCDAYIRWSGASALCSLNEWVRICEQHGLIVLRTKDFGCHLVASYRRLLQQAELVRENGGFDEKDEVEKQIEALQENIDKLKSNDAQGWAAVVALKPLDDGSGEKLALHANGTG